MLAVFEAFGFYMERSYCENPSGERSLDTSSYVHVFRRDAATAFLLTSITGWTLVFMSRKLCLKQRIAILNLSESLVTLVACELSKDDGR